MTIDLAAALGDLAACAHQGGQVALDFFTRGATAQGLLEKGPRDFQTEADRAVERAVAAELARRLPGIGIEGEERQADRAPTGTLRVLIDPIDGTTNFVAGIPFFAVCLALVDGDTVVAGIVHDPVRSETFAAARGAGCTLNGIALQMETPRPLDRAVIGASIPIPGQLRSVDEATYRYAFWRVADHAAAVRRLGSAALSIAYVAAGRHDAFFEDGLSPHDYAAAVLCVEEAGGIASGFDGLPIPPTGAVLVATPALHPWLVEGFAQREP